MANRYNRRNDEKGDAVTNVAGIAGAVFSAAKAVGKLAVYDPTGLLDGAAAIGKSSSLVKEEMKRNQKYRERIEKTEKYQRIIASIFLIVLVILCVVMFVINNTFCNMYLSWMMVTAIGTLMIACIGIIYDKKGHLILGALIFGVVFLIDAAFVIGSVISGLSFSDSIKTALLLLLFCTIGLIIGLVINHISAEIADKKY